MLRGRPHEINVRVGSCGLGEPSDDELELERDMEYFVEPEEALGPRIGEPGE